MGLPYSWDQIPLKQAEAANHLVEKVDSRDVVAWERCYFLP
jgi:hypothetical protein